MLAEKLVELETHKDPSVAMSGQVGSQIKMSVGKSWLIANVRTLRAADNGMVIANVDFLGEGDRDSNGRLTKFRRGVTRFPIPGCQVHAVTPGSCGRCSPPKTSAIEVGTVYPTDESAARF